ncbi:SDR family NAD(P)-dependent oxidoreductase [Pseudooceanicola sp. 502str34]
MDSTLPALILGASGGFGQALAETLAARGLPVTRLSRSADGFDITDPASVDHHLDALDGPFGLILCATGALAAPGDRPEKSLRDLEATAMAQQFAVNAIGPALVLKHAPRLLPRDQRAVFAALSARVGSIGDNGLGGWYSYRASKAALNQLIHTGAIELARSHRHALCLALHPGTVATRFTRDYRGRHPAVPPEEAAANLLGVIESLGPEATGGFYDWRGEAVPW